MVPLPLSLSPSLPLSLSFRVVSFGAFPDCVDDPLGDHSCMKSTWMFLSMPLVCKWKWENAKQSQQSKFYARILVIAVIVSLLHPRRVDCSRNHLSHIKSMTRWIQSRLTHRHRCHTALWNRTQVRFWIPVKIPAEYDYLKPWVPENAKIKIL